METEMTREEMAEKIKAYSFAITDISLYLDTHPEDEKALCLHKNYCK
ncbi:spore coat protein CotJB, partial [Salmonella enterica]